MFCGCCLVISHLPMCKKKPKKTKSWQETASSSTAQDLLDLPKASMARVVIIFTHFTTRNVRSTFWPCWRRSGWQGKHLIDASVFFSINGTFGHRVISLRRREHKAEINANRPHVKVCTIRSFYRALYTKKLFFHAHRRGLL